MINRRLLEFDKNSDVFLENEFQNEEPILLQGNLIFIGKIKRISNSEGLKIFQIIIETVDHQLLFLEYDQFFDYYSDWNYLTYKLFHSKIEIVINRRKYI